MYPRLRDLREDRDLSQREVAKLLEMSQTGYSKYETGENDIPTSVLQRLAGPLPEKVSLRIKTHPVCQGNRLTDGVYVCF